MKLTFTFLLIFLLIFLGCSENPTVVSGISELDSLVITQPIDEDSLFFGDTLSICWKVYGKTKVNVDMDYSIENNTWNKIIDNYPINILKYDWVISGFPTSNLRIRICLANTDSILDEIKNINIIGKGGISGFLRGDGILVPNRGYNNFIIKLYKDGDLVNIDTTKNGGNYRFDNLIIGNYELESIADFGYENISYGKELVKLNNTFVEKDITLDSLKYDFCRLRIGGNYTFSTSDYEYGLYPGDCYRKYLSIITLTIQDSISNGDTILYHFQGEQVYTTRENTCDPNIRDSIYMISGYFISYNSYTKCIVQSNGADELAYYRGIHIFDGTEETKNFLKFNVPGGWESQILFGDPFIINSQQYETLNIFLPIDIGGHVNFNFSYDLGTVFAEYHTEFISMSSNYSNTKKITLSDFSFE